MRSAVQRSYMVALAPSGQVPSLQTRFAVWLISGSFWHTEHRLYITKDLSGNSYSSPLNELSVQWPFCEANTALTWATVLFVCGAGCPVIPESFPECIPGRTALDLTYIHKMVVPTLDPVTRHRLPFLLSFLGNLLSHLQPQGCLGRSPGVVKLQANLFVNS